MAKRIAWLMALLSLLTLGGCGEVPQTTAPDQQTATTAPAEVEQEALRLSLAYSHDDTLNPFSAATEVNCQLTALLYEGLLVLDENAVPQLGLADAVAQPDDRQLTVTLRQKAVFSDGTAVTPEDVIASFQEAKKSQRYGALLANVFSAQKEGAGIRFQLKSADTNARACLTFPIVKASTLTDKAGKAPIGSGIYKFKSTDKGDSLVQNKKHPTAPQFKTITLHHLPNNATRQYALASGEITYYYDDLSEGEMPRISGASSKVATNTLVFMGINSTKGKLKDAPVRRALSQVLNRAAITQTAYGEWAVASAAPWPSHWDRMSGETVSAERDLDGAIALLNEAECTPVSGKRLELTLIYNADRPDRGKLAEQIRAQAEDAGIALNPEALSEKEYRTRLKNGRYDLYLGEIRLTADMSLRPLLAGGDASYGIARSGAAAKAYAQYLKEDLTLSKFLAAFAEDMPYIPLCWRYGAAGFDRRLTTATPTGTDPYYGIAEWQ